MQALALALAAPDLPQSLVITRQALTLAQQLGDVKGQTRALLLLSTLARRQTNYEQARHYAQQAQRLFVRQANRRGLSQVYLELSLIDLIQGNFAQAINAGLRGLPLAEQTGAVMTQTRLQATLGSLYARLGDHNAAIPMLKAALRNGEGKDPQVTISAATELGTVYQEQKNWRLALRYFQQALQIAREQQDQQSETVALVNLADAYWSQGNYAQARVYSGQARARAHAAQDTYILPNAELILAKLYLHTHQLDSALTLARHALQLSQQARSQTNLQDANKLLAQAYAQRGNFTEAYRHQRLYMAYSDTLKGEETQRKTSALRYGYELDKKQAQIALLTKTRQLQAQQSIRQRQQLYALLAGLGSVVLVAGLLWRNVVLKQRANQRLNAKNDQIAQQRDNLNRTLTQLKATQNQLIQREKMASLGELTAGVAHEIQNPLNFINNFAEVSVELAAELATELAQENISSKGQPLITELLQDLTQNQQKIHQHGQRADGIVKNMLAHSRSGAGQHQLLDVNALAQEAWRLAYQGARTKNSHFKAKLALHLAPNLGSVSGIASDITQALLNLFANACYATAEKQKQLGAAYQPEIVLTTRDLGTQVEIQIRDNGIGVAPAIGEKIFQPFFTTKPPGEGTGLGLSLSYDIITKGYGGSLTFISEEGEFTAFTCVVPRQPAEDQTEI
ncbi:hypothetical protein GCM10011383_26610 [Hymenobacter cavernae]|uniref:histidine kinase n=1 Tax=Hymenobacter cavernae TaxID=2044852 RepID=A0ABQ1UD12_9BACT|nr:hypothetical protein GCM10011383_26610 [Hymenobacter cavernae]